MTLQKHLFDLPDDIHYLNCAYMSPQLRSVQEAGIEGVRIKSDPSAFDTSDMYRPAEILREKFAGLIHCTSQQVAIIPAVSYGIQSAVTNIPTNTGDHLIVVSEEFPSDYYAAEAWCRKHNKKLKTIAAPVELSGRAQRWNEAILDAINSQTSAVILSSIHWTDGTIFDLGQIGKRCRETNALFIVDGTQSVGAMPIDVIQSNIDALVCAGYKWLMGPYSLGVAYYGPAFDHGAPIEEAWPNRPDSLSSSGARNYIDSYEPGAGRYNAGEHGNLILLPMLNKAIQQVLDWKVERIGTYCSELIRPAISFLQENGYWVEDEKYRAPHLFGFLPRTAQNRDELLRQLKAKKIFVSARGKGIRVSPYLYNTPADLEAMVTVLKDA